MCRITTRALRLCFYRNGGQSGATKVTMSKLTWLRRFAATCSAGWGSKVLKESLQQANDFVFRSRHDSIKRTDPISGSGVGAAQLEYRTLFWSGFRRYPHVAISDRRTID